MQPTMNTNSEQLLEAGLETGRQAFECLLKESGWSRDSFAATICHQVGAAHRRRMLEKLELKPETDFATFETLGNTGSVALPTALARALEEGFLPQQGHCGLLGIGSGVNSLMIGLELGPVTVRSKEAF
jgi:3-oxoacyl-[acyl-carrier-protein] synthase-3